MTAHRHITADGTGLHWTDTGAGPTVLFQHGLGGNDDQVAGCFPTGAGVHRITVECRGHGQSGYGATPASFDLFDADLRGFRAAHAGGAVVLGGISMGAALALKAACADSRADNRDVRALVLMRPAWAAGPVRENMSFVRHVAQDILAGGTIQGFDASDMAADMAQRSPDNLASLRGYYLRPDALRFAAVAAAMAADDPGVSPQDLSALRLPVLVLAAPRDLIHPLSLARDLADAIPGAQYHLLPDKAQDGAGHRHAAATAIATFLSSISKG
ncbi:MAG TPA: alpha/beta hydrolase [Paenirhodobacter sp.]